MTTFVSRPWSKSYRSGWKVLERLIKDVILSHRKRESAQDGLREFLAPLSSPSL